MNAADEHGVIHPEACRHPITGNKKKVSVPAAGGSSNSGETSRAPANDRSVSKPSSTTNNQPPVAAVEKGCSNNNGDRKRASGNDRSVSDPTTTNQTPSAATENEAPSGAGGDATAERLATARDASAAVAGEAIRPFLLSVLQDMCELARPEIAASAIVAGACKVRKWMKVFWMTKPLGLRAVWTWW